MCDREASGAIITSSFNGAPIYSARMDRCIVPAKISPSSSGRPTCPSNGISRRDSTGAQVCVFDARPYCYSGSSLKRVGDTQRDGAEILACVADDECSSGSVGVDASFRVKCVPPSDGDAGEQGGDLVVRGQTPAASNGEGDGSSSTGQAVDGGTSSIAGAVAGGVVGVLLLAILLMALLVRRKRRNPKSAPLVRRDTVDMQSNPLFNAPSNKVGTDADAGGFQPQMVDSHANPTYGLGIEFNGGGGGGGGGGDGDNGSTAYYSTPGTALPPANGLSDDAKYASASSFEGGAAVPGRASAAQNPSYDAFLGGGSSKTDYASPLGLHATYVAGKGSTTNGDYAYTPAYDVAIDSIEKSDAMDNYSTPAGGIVGTGITGLYESPDSAGYDTASAALYTPYSTAQMPAADAGSVDMGNYDNPRASFHGQPRQNSSDANGYQQASAAESAVGHGMPSAAEYVAYSIAALPVATDAVDQDAGNYSNPRGSAHFDAEC